MALLLLIMAIGFCLLPLDAQLWIIGLIRSAPPEGAFLLLALGWPAFWYALGWNTLAAQQRDQAFEKADQTYRQTRR